MPETGIVVTDSEIEHPGVAAQAMIHSLHRALEDVLTGKITPEQAFAAAKLANESCKMLDLGIRCYELITAANGESA